MVDNTIPSIHAAAVASLREVRVLIDEGVSQADIAREIGVSRQAVQKMLAG